MRLLKDKNLLVKDVKWIVEIDQNKKYIVIPVVLNSDKTKVKNLLNNQVFDVVCNGAVKLENYCYKSLDSYSFNEENIANKICTPLFFNDKANKNLIESANVKQLKNEYVLLDKTMLIQIMNTATNYTKQVSKPASVELGKSKIFGYFNNKLIDNYKPYFYFNAISDTLTIGQAKKIANYVQDLLQTKYNDYKQKTWSIEDLFAV